MRKAIFILGIVLLILGILSLLIGGIPVVVLGGGIPPLTNVVAVEPPSPAYTSKAVLEVSRGPNISTATVASEIQKLQSSEVLGRVIEELKLRDVWAKKYNQPGPLSPLMAMSILRPTVNVQRQPNTTLVEVRVVSEDKDEAAMIANKVAEVYRDRAATLENRNDVRVIEVANPNPAPVRVGLPLNIVLGLVLGCVFMASGGVLIFFARRMTRP